MTEIDRIHCVLLAGLALKGLALRPSGILHFYFEHFVVHTDTAAPPAWRLWSFIKCIIMVVRCACSCILRDSKSLEQKNHIVSDSELTIFLFFWYRNSSVPQLSTLIKWFWTMAFGFFYFRSKKKIRHLMARTAEPSPWFPSKCTDKYMPLAKNTKDFPV